MKFFELIDRNIYRRVINIEYHNDQDVLLTGMKEKKKMKINNADSYMIDDIDDHIFSLLFKKHVYSEGIDSLDVEITIRIKCGMRADKRTGHSFLKMDINDLIQNNTNVIFAGVPHICSALLSNIMMSFGESPLILPPKLNLQD
ncbi:MAG: hypothetical protein K9L26_02105 [Candidatus Izimaplasma sp.]|nr:hypothetical protein [Candidatus Izimaplasma bacterium]